MAGINDILNGSSLSGTYSFDGGRGGSAAPSAAYGGSSTLDSSGWNVNFGGGKIESARGLDLGAYGPYLIIAAVGVLVWKAMKKS